MVQLRLSRCGYVTTSAPIHHGHVRGTWVLGKIKTGLTDEVGDAFELLLLVLQGLDPCTIRAKQDTFSRNVFVLKSVVINFSQLCLGPDLTEEGALVLRFVFHEEGLLICWLIVVVDNT